jgi:hypothetical protein
MFVYSSIVAEGDDRPDPVVITIGETDTDHEGVHASFQRFDVRACNCQKADDSNRIIALIGGSSTGVNGFNDFVRKFALDQYGKASQASARSSELGVCSQELGVGVVELVSDQNSSWTMDSSYRGYAASELLPDNIPGTPIEIQSKVPPVQPTSLQFEERPSCH